MRLKDKVVLVTGASRGLGHALAVALAREGSKVTICARQAQALQRVKQELESQGTDALAIPADVGKSQDVERLVATTLLTYGQIDVLINNASILGPTPLPYLIDTPTEAFEELLRTNVLGPFMVTKAVLPGMIERGRGSIISVISEAGINAYANWGAYGASKAALELMTRVWAAELEGTGVRVTAVDPGEMDTAMHALALPEEDPTQYPKPEEVIDVFLWLASDESLDVTGRLFQAQEFKLGQSQS